MTEQQAQATNWLDEELQTTQTPANFEQLPSLKLQPNKLTEITVDFSKPFEKWTDSVSKVTKAIIPVTLAGVKHNFWLNTRNPLYHQLLEQGKAGKSQFKVLQTGTQAETKYNLVE